MMNLAAATTATTATTRKPAMILVLLLCFCLNSVCHAKLMRGRVSTVTLNQILSSSLSSSSSSIIRNEKDPKGSQAEEYVFQGNGLCASSKGEQYNIVSYVINDEVETDTNPINPITLCNQEKYCGNTEFVTRGFQYINEGGNAKFCECLFETKDFPAYDMLRSSSEKFNTLFGVTTDLVGEGTIKSVTKPMLSMVVAECYSKNRYSGVTLEGTMTSPVANDEEKTEKEIKNHESLKKDENKREEEKGTLSLDDYLEQKVGKNREEKSIKEESTPLVGGVVHSSESIENIVERIHHGVEPKISKNRNTSFREDEHKKEREEQALSLDEYLEQAIKRQEKVTKSNDTLKKSGSNTDIGEEEEQIFSLDDYLEQTVKRQEKKLNVEKSAPLVGGVMHSSEPLEKIIERIHHGSESKISKNHNSLEENENNSEKKEQASSLDEYFEQMVVKKKVTKFSEDKSALLVGGVMHSSEPLENIIEMIYHGSEPKISKGQEILKNDEKKTLSLDEYLEQSVVKKQEKEATMGDSTPSLGSIMHSSEPSEKMTKRNHHISNPKLSYLHAMEYMYI